MPAHKGGASYVKAADLLVPMIRLLSKADVPDAVELVERRQGKNNLQAHAAHLVRLAVKFLLENKRLISPLAQRTRLWAPLSGREDVWTRVQGPFVSFIAKTNSKKVSVTIRTGQPITVGKVAHTYLPQVWGGSHKTGGAGASTLKRALKLAGHILRAFGDVR
jgi:hypothetical protein